jgi:hypothetical protein
VFFKGLHESKDPQFSLILTILHKSIPDIEKAEFGDGDCWGWGLLKDYVLK